jgi:hypothetical protein
MYIDQSNILEGSTAAVEHKNKQEAAVEPAESINLCQHPYWTHIKSITVFVHDDDRVDMASGNFMDKRVMLT